MTKKQLLTDTMTIRLAVVESAESGKLIARGEFARCGVATANGRVYPESLWKKNLGRLNRDLAERKMLGELDHPADGKTMLARVSHLITNLSIDDNGVVVGEAEILPGTDKGKQLKALVDAGVAVGVSSRGYGSVKENAEGIDVVQDDYVLMTFDFVVDPANLSSFPSFSTESSGKVGNMAEAYLVHDFKRLRPDAEALAKKHGGSVKGSHLMFSDEKTSTAFAREHNDLVNKENPKKTLKDYAIPVDDSKPGYDDFSKKQGFKEDSEKYGIALPEGGQVIEPSQVQDPADPALQGENPEASSDAQWVKQAAKTTAQGLRIYPAIVSSRQVWVSIPEEGQIESAPTSGQSKLTPEEVQAQVAIAVNETESRVRDEIAATLGSDPSVAGARAALESVKTILRPYVVEADIAAELAAKDTKISNLGEEIKDLARLLMHKEAENDALTSACKDMGYSLYLHKNLSFHPKFESILSGLGNLTEIASLAKLKALVAVHVSEAAEIRQRSEQSQATKLVQLENKVATLSSDVRNLRSERDEALKSSVEANARVYLERRLVGHPSATEVRTAWEASKLTSPSQINALVESFKRRVESTSLIESVRTGLSKRSLPGNRSMVEDSLNGTRASDAHRVKAVPVIPGSDLTEAQFETLAGMNG